MRLCTGLIDSMWDSHRVGGLGYLFRPGDTTRCNVTIVCRTFHDLLMPAPALCLDPWIGSNATPMGTLCIFKLCGCEARNAPSCIAPKAPTPWKVLAGPNFLGPTAVREISAMSGGEVCPHPNLFHPSLTALKTYGLRECATKRKPAVGRPKQV